MYYAAMRQYDVANGTGIRASLFVSGCTHDCKGCFNGVYQNFKYGKPWDEEAQKQFLGYMNNPNIKGATILGGEPMEQTRDRDLCELLKVLRETGKDIWIYSGFTYEQILDDPRKKELLTLCDVLVDGKFEEDKKDLMLKFRGSSNQRIIDVQASLKGGTIVLLALE